MDFQVTVFKFEDQKFLERHLMLMYLGTSVPAKAEIVLQLQNQ